MASSAVLQHCGFISRRAGALHVTTTSNTFYFSELPGGVSTATFNEVGLNLSVL
jgi:hypothetical protein